MAKFLTTTGISYELEEIIRRAEERLYLISPFLKVNKRLKELLENKRPSVDIRVIFGKSELQPDESEWLQGLDAVKTSYRKDLHAKCYLNEDKALLTSMNLYEFSEKNNDEMGVLISRQEDPELYDDIFKGAKDILDNSEQVRVTVARVESDEDRAERPRSRGSPAAAQAPDTGFCIRCRDTIPANAGRPYCYPHFKDWNRSKDENSKEKRCHICGKGHNKATKRNPAHLACYRKYKSWVDSTKK